MYVLAISILIVSDFFRPTFSSEFRCLENAKITDPPLVHIPETVTHFQNATSIDPDLYVVKHGVKTVVINCTSNEPVDWKFKGSIGNTLVNSKRSFTFDSFYNGSLTRACYYSALEFTSIEEEITGQYSCIIRPSYVDLSPSNAKPLTSNGKHVFVLFSGLSALTVRNRSLTYDNWYEEAFSREHYELPCAANHPAATVQLFYKDLKTDMWTLENNTEVSPGSHILVHLPSDLRPRYYKCEGNLNDSVTEELYIHIPQFPDVILFPKHLNLNYKIPHGKSIAFACYTKVPSEMIQVHPNGRIKFNVLSDLLGSTQVPLQKLGYEHQSTAVLTSLGVIKFQNESNAGKVRCVEKETMKIIGEWDYYEVGEEEDASLFNGNGTYVYELSAVPENTTMQFVKANNAIEMHMRINCLQVAHQNWGLCNHRQPNIHTQTRNNIYAYFHSREINSTGLYQWINPLSRIKYQYFVQMPTGFYVSGKYPGDTFLEINIPIKDVKVGDIIQGHCVSSNAYFYGYGIWVYVWKNNSETNVPQTSIINDQVTENGSMTIRQSDIVMESVDLDKLACYGFAAIYNKDTWVSKHSNRIRVVLRAVRENDPSAILYTSLSVSLVAIVIVGIVMSCWWFKWRKLTEKDFTFQECVQTFFEGYEDRVKDENNIYSEVTCKPYDTQYEVPLHNLKIDWGCPLGSGAFGLVLKASVSGEKFTALTTVAVKTVRGSPDIQYIRALMMELKIMIYIGKQPNVVNLLGACTINLLNKELYLIMEYCKQGSLQKYLIDGRPTYSHDSDNCTFKEQLQKEGVQSIFSKYEITIVDLFRWSRQIIFGMEYLATKKVIHGDLACRNVLLDEVLTAKIADFGLSRRLYERCEYVKKSDDPLPWRWMAVESLKDMSFTEASDVWSFGVTMWEIFSLAQIPYSGMSYTPDFINSLEKGYRLGKAEHSFDELHSIMMECWNTLPSKRPNFNQLGEIFDKLLINGQGITSTDYYNTVQE